MRLDHLLSKENRSAEAGVPRIKAAEQPGMQRHTQVCRPFRGRSRLNASQHECERRDKRAAPEAEMQGERSVTWRRKPSISKLLVSQGDFGFECCSILRVLPSERSEDRRQM